MTRFKDSPHNEAKELVEAHEFRDIPEYKARGTATAGYYKHPTDAAQAMVDSYYSEGAVMAEPKSIAVAAIHAASLMFNIKESQVELAEQYNCSTSVIGRRYDDMLENVLLDKKEVNN